MPLVKNTVTGNNYLVKISTDGDACSRTAVRSYNKQLGSQGLAGRTRFYLPFTYVPGSHTLWVFINGEKAVVENIASNNRQYVETSEKIVTLGAAVNPDDVLEFIVAGSYISAYGDGTGDGGSDGGITWILVTGDTMIQRFFGYMADTSSGPLVFTLPPNPEEGDTFSVCDAVGTFGTNPVTLLRNGNNIDGLAQDMILDKDGMMVELVFNGIDNWIVTGTADHNKLVNYVPLRHRLITLSTALPTGGEDTDMHIRVF